MDITISNTERAGSVRVRMGQDPRSNVQREFIQVNVSEQAGGEFLLNPEEATALAEALLLHATMMRGHTLR